MTLYGIDVSNHQKNFDFAAAKREGFVFATHKVTEADNYLDPYWGRAREEMARHFPGRHGGYVFCRTNVDPNREADFLAKHMSTDIPLQVDYEDTKNGGSGDDLFRRVRAYQERGFHLLPIYLPRWFWDGHMGRPNLAGLPVGIWNSHYTSNTGFASTLYERHPALNAAWADLGGKKVELLQFTEKALVANQLIDANAFRGTEAELDAMFRRPTSQGEIKMEPKDIPSAVLEQELGPHGNGWPQLGGRSQVDALGVILQQLVGPDPAAFDGWEQLGDVTLVDAVATALENQGVLFDRIEALDSKLQEILGLLKGTR